MDSMHEQQDCNTSLDLVPHDVISHELGKLVWTTECSGVHTSSEDNSSKVVNSVSLSSWEKRISHTWQELNLSLELLDIFV